MTRPLNFTLLTDGSSDRVLMPILRWLLNEHLPKTPIDGQWADLSTLRQKPVELNQRIEYALRLYPCDVLFIHRDAEAQPADIRYEQIEQAYRQVDSQKPPHICVVPIRMQEAWLLLDEHAIRMSANNPNGRVKLSLPLPKALEDHADPKARLHELLKQASELKGRRLDQFDARRLAHQIPEHMTDFTALRQLSAFQRLEDDVRRWADASALPDRAD